MTPSFAVQMLLLSGTTCFTFGSAVLCCIVIRRFGRRPFWILWSIGFTLAGAARVLRLLRMGGAASAVDDDAMLMIEMAAAFIASGLICAGFIGLTMNVRDAHRRAQSKPTTKESPMKPEVAACVERAETSTDSSVVFLATLLREFDDARQRLEGINESAAAEMQPSERKERRRQHVTSA